MNYGSGAAQRPVDKRYAQHATLRHGKSSREKAKVGIFITLADATGPMKTEAVKAGFYETPHHGKVPKLQILTIADLFAGKKPQIPFVDATSFKTAPREKTTDQGKLL